MQNGLRARREHCPHTDSTTVPLTPSHKHDLDWLHAKSQGPQPSGIRRTDAAPVSAFATRVRPVCACAHVCTCVPPALAASEASATQPCLARRVRWLEEATSSSSQSHICQHTSTVTFSICLTCAMAQVAWAEVEVRAASTHLIAARTAP